MAKEKQKMTLNVRRRATTSSPSSAAAPPPAVEIDKIEAFASGAENAAKQAVKQATEKTSTTTGATEEKVIRDAFTMPAQDHALFAEIQEKCVAAGLVVTKSEIVRAGLHSFVNMETSKLKAAMQAVPKIKTGRRSIRHK